MSDYLETLDGFEKTLPSNWYLDSDIFELEREHIFMREWLCVGREEQFPNSGDCKVLDIYGESILVVRNNTGSMRSFYNVCRHRGAQLCPSESESDQSGLLRGGLAGGKAFVCPYHAWTYDLDGQLQRAPHLDESLGLEVEKVKLHPVGCETWGGFIFLNLSPEAAPPFSSHIAEIDERYQRYPLESLVIGKTIEYEVNANWKVLCENYNECYHCGPVHPELCQVVPAFRKNGGANLDWERGVPHREGANTFTMSGTTHRTPFPGLNEDELNRHKGDLLYPNLFISLAADHVAVFILKAIAAQKTKIECHFLFEEKEVKSPQFEPSDAVDFWHLVNLQDWAICERVQKGTASRVHSFGILSPMEDWNLDLRGYVKDRIGPYIESS